VVARTPCSSPAAPQIRAPVQTEKTYLACAACPRTNERTASSSINCSYMKPGAGNPRQHFEWAREVHLIHAGKDDRADLDTAHII